MVNVLVKVGKKSNVKLANCSVRRAITFNEAKKLLDKEDFKVVVIDEPEQKDEDKIEELDRICGNKGCRVFIYSENTDINYVRLSTYHSMGRLQKDISNYCGTDIRTGEFEDTDEEQSLSASGSTINGSNNTETVNDKSDEVSKHASENKELADEFSTGVHGEKSSVQEGEIFDKNENESKSSAEYLSEMERLSSEQMSAVKKQYLNLKKDYDELLEKVHAAFISGEAVEYIGSSESAKDMAEQIRVLTGYKTKSEELLREISELERENKESRKKIDEICEELGELKEENELAESGRLELSRVIREVCWKAYRAEKNLADKINELNSALRNINSCEEKIKQLATEFATFKKSSEENENLLNMEITRLSEELVEANENLDDTSEKCMKQAEEINAKTGEIEKQKAEIRELSNALENCQAELGLASNEANRFREMGVEEMMDQLESLKHANDTLMQQLGIKEREKDGLEMELSAAKMGLSDALGDVDNLSKVAKGMARGRDAGEQLQVSCDYAGRAFIIPVFSSGSYGATSVACAIAQELNGRTLVIDMDIVNPKMDNWYQTMPIIKELDGINSEIKKTGIGALVEKGAPYVIDRKDKIVKRVYTNDKTGHTVDYISGAYSRVNLFKFMSIEFSEFLTYFGNEYDFMIFDCGRLGGSEIEAAIIRMLSRLALNSIVVTSSQEGDCRTMAVRLQAEGIYGDKIIWVRNMNKGTKLTQVAQKSISYAAENTTITFDSGVYGEVVKLNENRRTKEDIERLVGIILK